MGFAGSVVGAFRSSLELRGSCGNVCDVEFSEDLALAIGGLASSVDFFSGKICADGTGFCSSAIGFSSSLVASDGAAGSGFLSANTE